MKLYTSSALGSPRARNKVATRKAGRLSRFSLIAGAIVLLALISARAQAGSITYVYDAGDRLEAAVDSSGNVVAYQYDAVGNLWGIARGNPVAFAMVPISGSVGATQIKIYGSGFSSTANQNTVKFNGTAAAVSSASPTVLVVTVPSGATTGPVTVTSPNGSGTSSTNFTVQ